MKCDPVRWNLGVDRNIIRWVHSISCNFFDLQFVRLKCMRFASSLNVLSTILWIRSDPKIRSAGNSVWSDPSHFSSKLVFITLSYYFGIGLKYVPHFYHFLPVFDSFRFRKFSHSQKRLRLRCAPPLPSALAFVFLSLTFPQSKCAIIDK